MPEHLNVKKNKYLNLPLVSIIIPVYNAAPFLGECIDSLLRQNYKQLEIICVDDGSTDASSQILEYYRMKDPRIICTYQENAGQSVARNKGISMATGDYICFLDSDDFLIPNAIFQCIETFEKYDVDIVLFNMEMFLPSGQHFKCFDGELYSHHNPILHSEKDEICVNFTNAAAGMFKTKDLIENHISFPPGMIYEDWVFMVRLMCAKNFSIFWLDSPLYWYRRDFTATTTSNISHKCLDLFQAYRMADFHLRSTITHRHQIFINDEKIVNEATGFLIARLQNSFDINILKSYVKEFLNILCSFPESYIQSLFSFLTPERAEVVHYLYQNSSESDIDLLVKNIRIQMHQQRHKAQFRQIKGRLYSIASQFYHLLKKLMSFVFPAYWVSNNLREKVDHLLWQNSQMEYQIQQLYKMNLPPQKTTFDMENTTDETT